MWDFFLNVHLRSHVTLVVQFHLYNSHACRVYSREFFTRDILAIPGREKFPVPGISQFIDIFGTP